MAEAERVAVRRGAHCAPDPDGAAGSGDVLDDHRLAERDAHPLADGARDRVGRPAGRERHHDRDRTRWIGLRLRAAEAERNDRRGQNGLSHVPSRTHAGSWAQVWRNWTKAATINHSLTIIHGF